MQLKNNTVYLGDSVNYCQDFENPYYHLILTDIPYLISRKNQFKTMGREGFNFDWDQTFDINDLRHLPNVLKPGGSLVLFSSFQQIGAIEEVLINAGLKAKDKIIAVKSNPQPRNTKRRFVPALESISWFVKPGAKWTFNRRPGKKYENGLFEASIPLKLKKFHPTAKPISILEDLIYIFSNKGEIVFDPFAGCNTTAIAASNIGRKFITVEIDEKIHEKACQLLTEKEIKFHAEKIPIQYNKTNNS